jgi:hypothetical protein
MHARACSGEQLGLPRRRGSASRHDRALAFERKKHRQPRQRINAGGNQLIPAQAGIQD